MKEIKTASYIKYAKEKCKGWTAVRLDSSMSKKIQEWGKENIPSEELADDGREDDIHITVLYGICTHNEEIVKTLLKTEKPIKATLGKIGCFINNDGFDVVIIKIDSPDLEELHRKIKESLNVELTHDSYKPHCTIAYVKKGEAKKYAGQDVFCGKKITFNKIIFKDTLSVNDDSNKKETIINLKSD